VGALRLSVIAFAALLIVAAPACAAPVSGRVDDDAIVVINGDVQVEPGETVDGVFIVSGDARIDGRVDGDVVLVAGDALIRGHVDGNVATIAGHARLLPKARVDGDLIYGDERPQVAPRAVVAGNTEKVGWSDSLGVLPFVAAFAFWLAVSISTAILGVLLLLLAPRAADAAIAQSRSRFWTAIGIGAGIFIGLPLIAFLAAITLIGLPLAIGVGLALLPLAAIAYTTAALVLGRLMVKPPASRILAFLAGLAILRVAALLPAIGLLVWLGAVVVGLGLLGAAITAARAEASGGH
jgi:cytoskeletal protein CcmA (bactofilin family)